MTVSQLVGNTRGTCGCDGQACVCRTAPLSGLRYFSETGRPCECDPDRCYNPDYNYTEVQAAEQIMSGRHRARSNHNNLSFPYRVYV